jgi:uncharacterized protein
MSRKPDIDAEFLDRIFTRKLQEASGLKIAKYFSDNELEDVQQLLEQAVAKNLPPAIAIQIDQEAPARLPEGTASNCPGALILNFDVVQQTTGQSASVATTSSARPVLNALERRQRPLKLRALALAASLALLMVGFAYSLLISGSKQQPSSPPFQAAKFPIEKKANETPADIFAGTPEGDPALLVAHLEEAAGRGDVAVSMKIANLLDRARPLEAELLKVCKLYIKLTDKNANINGAVPDDLMVAEAFRRAGHCYSKGILLEGHGDNRRVAAELYYHGGVRLGDSESLFELGKRYISGQGVQPNPHIGAMYLDIAAKKHYAPAQALLGSLLTEGKVVKRQSVTGLALLMAAVKNTSPGDAGWIRRAYEDALLTASNQEEAEARRLSSSLQSSSGGNTSASPIVISTPSTIPPTITNSPVPFPGSTSNPTRVGAPKETNEYTTMPTGATVPLTAAPPSE